ncbi:nucleoside triphosphate pyrophosphohydrolase family protein [Ponticaulis koreensis]|uniref:nucleoside triphosphate pyrophosphohydrolase family protein n=1 Tax=Ponticaulis koreensis TaxID=1123045 RepID=UPI0003B43B9A|nr:nucleoside triphosphate pyrophosphohydrolase family protein [Ponticaulis koreensis]
MNFDDYQTRAEVTDRVPAKAATSHQDAVIVPMLGLAGEAGQLLSEYKKHLRDGDAHTLFKSKVAEELGDLLWYVSNVATKFDIKLSDVASQNIEKIESRWLRQRSAKQFFDDDFEAEQQLPRRARIEIISLDEKKVRILLDGRKIGADLTDNSYAEDGYRFHDVFHFAFAAVLGWSPVTRAIIGAKRRSAPDIDEIEDGGRAIVIEEGLSALIFEYARRHNFLEGVTRLDYGLLRTIQDMTGHLEVRTRTPADWENAILQGYMVWRLIAASKGGVLEIDQETKTIKCISE